MKRTINLAIKMLVDLALLVLFILIMGYHVFENPVHEALGISIFSIFVLHTALNYKWYITLFKGKYTPTRIYKLVINISLLVFMILTLSSALMISLSLFKDLNLGNVALGRTLHLICTMWCFTLVSFHLGFHGSYLKAIILKKYGRNKILNWCLRLVFIGLSAYGLYAYITRRLYEPMFGLTEFVFMPYGEPFAKFFFEYLALVALFATASYYFNSLLLHLNIIKKRFIKNKKEGE